LQASPEHAPVRPRVGIAPRLTDAELVTLAVRQALLGRTSEARWLRFAQAQLRHLFPYLPQQSGYNKRLRRLADTIRWLIGVLARDTALWSDDAWVVDSTPVECGRSRETAHRSELAGWAEYGYCASHSRFFWGLRLHLLCTLHGLPVGFAVSGAKADEREVLLGVLQAYPTLTVGRSGQTVIADRQYYGRQFENTLLSHGLTLLRPARAGETPRPGTRFSSRCARSSSRSTTPSKANSTWNTTAGTPRWGSGCASCNASWPSPPPCGTTTTSAHQLHDH
jgi:hypothetical protein